MGGPVLIEGSVFCNRPALLYTTGIIGLGMWYAETFTTLILAVNRCMMLYKPNLADRLFNSRHSTTLWLALPTSISLIFSWYSPPLIFNSMSASSFANPHLHYLPDNQYYHSPIHKYYNCFLVCALVSIYVIFGLLFHRKFHGSALQRSSRRDFGTFVQVLITCTLACITAVGYIIQQTFPDFKPLVMSSTYGYVFYQGSPSIIYLCMNKSIRQAVLGRYNRVSGKSSFFNKTARQSIVNTISNRETLK
ncbi:serpentine type 7TM GPCR chemoreceptor srt domain-containing protein [Ditylenchus destructor]|nr:serpentine type 7TM GPCR chemoreceptor srt domain-containing protein [Ditylenchus destructor]